MGDKQSNRFSWRDALGLLLPYIRNRITEQIRAVALIVIYLILFQTLVLGIAIQEAGVIAFGLAMVIVGLAFFMEGLLLGLMPLGETIGIRLPQRSPVWLILIFAFILGAGATFAEPAIGVLQSAGESVLFFEAPLLYLLLNSYSDQVVFAVAAGVGIAVVMGMLRFIHNWSLKPFILTLIPILMVLTIASLLHENMRHLIGLAWDSGAVTTGPVTVPLVLALGIGITRLLARGESGSDGFGVVTLASLMPIVTVLLLGWFHSSKAPSPAETAIIFFSQTPASELELYLERTGLATFEAGSAEEAAAQRSAEPAVADPTTINLVELLKGGSFAAMRAILPLTLFLLGFLVFVMREKLPRADEVFLGIAFAFIGMAIFNIGIDLGLTKLGGQVGSKLPSSFATIQLFEEQKQIDGFDRSLIFSALGDDGSMQQFFYVRDGNQYVAIPFEERNLLEDNSYRYVPERGPLTGDTNRYLGYLIVLIFAFIMGYGATLAEPALNALGLKVEEVTVGTFRKSQLMQAVAIGVGFGIMLGLLRQIFDIPLPYLLLPPYALLLFLTYISSEQYVNIGWDSAGVTTGPITVPLVLAMGLGISSQIDVVEGFGILSMASVSPILSVLIMGLYIRYKQRADFVKKGDGNSSGVEAR